jgi:hypothetical protein
MKFAETELEEMRTLMNESRCMMLSVSAKLAPLSMVDVATSVRVFDAGMTPRAMTVVVAPDAAPHAISIGMETASGFVI